MGRADAAEAVYKASSNQIGLHDTPRSLIREFDQEESVCMKRGWARPNLTYCARAQNAAAVNILNLKVSGRFTLI